MSLSRALHPVVLGLTVGALVTGGLTTTASPAAADPSPTASASAGIPGHATAVISDPTPLRGDRVTVTGTGSVGVPTTLPDGDQEVLLTGTSGERASTGFALRPLLEDLLDRFLRWWPAERADASHLAGTPR
jgi:hypothetical protein